MAYLYPMVLLILKAYGPVRQYPPSPQSGRHLKQHVKFLYFKEMRRHYGQVPLTLAGKLTTGLEYASTKSFYIGPIPYHDPW